MFFNQFDAIVVVNLKERKDRRNEMERELQRVGLEGDPRVRFFEAIAMETAGPFRRVGSHGAFLSHLSVLKAARPGETLLILQDDCDFLPRATRNAPPQAWDILYGGYYASDPGDLLGSDIIGAHCMGFRPEVIPRLVAFLEEVYDGSYRPPDRTAQASEGAVLAAPIDGAIVWFRRAFPDVRTVFHKVSYQRSSRTDIGQLSRIDRFPRLALGARSILRKVKKLVLRFTTCSARGRD